MSGIRLFSLDSDRAFAEKVVEHLRLTVSRHEERDFEDGECLSLPYPSPQLASTINSAPKTGA